MGVFLVYFVGGKCWAAEWDEVAVVFKPDVSVGIGKEVLFHPVSFFLLYLVFEGSKVVVEDEVVSSVHGFETFCHWDSLCHFSKE
eukprot:2329195-Ditylum_brightwellii.AAC.1